MPRRRSLFRVPSLNKRIAARTSVKRYVRHSLGFKAPRGWGWLTNPKRAAYNRVYNRTSIGCAVIPLLFLVWMAAIACSTSSEGRQQQSATTGSTGAARLDTTPTPRTAAELPPADSLAIPAIAGKSSSQVAGILGQPTATETIHSRGRPLTKRYYRDGDIEIVYVNGKADWITVFGRGRLPFGPAVLPALGLPSAEPTFSNPAAVIRWETIPGIRELSVFPGGNGWAHYVYVLVNTKP